MALVTCPECGRENVSDSAVACPECGYGIKEHFDKIRIKEEAEKRRIEEQKRAEKARQEAEEKRRIQEQKRIEQAPQRQAQAIEQLEKKIQQYKILRIIGIVLAIGYFAFWVYGLIDTSWSNMAGLVGAALLVLLTLIASSQAKKLEEERIKAKNEFDEYERLLEERAKEERERQAEEYRRKEALLSKNVPCPVCGSRDTYRIGTLDRATSIAVTGLASGKIGKQYKCRKCKHMW